MHFKFILTLYLLCLLSLAKAQKFDDNSDEIIENISETLVDQASEEIDISEITDKLNFYKKHPINLNNANKEILEDLNFLNPLQINAILNHIHTTGKLIEIYELQGIEELDINTIKKLQLFSTIKQPSGFENFNMKQFFQHVNYSVLVKYQRVIEPQKGYITNPETNVTPYIGNADKIFTRIRIDYNQKLFLNINAEKDAGEKLISNSKNMPDFSSASVLIKDVGIFKKIVLGNYNLQFGQGLSLWTGLSFGKGADIFSVAKQNIGLKPYTSTNEFSYLNGLSTVLSWKRFSITPFVSYQKLDASSELNIETGKLEIGNLQQSGLHRTSSELKNKDRISELLYGTRINFTQRQFGIGITYHQNHFSENFAKENTFYKKFNFSDNQIGNVAFDFYATIKNNYFYGEYAQSINYGNAFLVGFLSSLNSKLSLVSLYRNYQKNYYSFYNQALSESTTATNEKSLYIGLQIKPIQKLELLLYADAFKFPWLKFQVNAPSNGYELLFQSKYNINKNSYVLLRARHENKQQNTADLTNILFLVPVSKTNFRTEFQYGINKSLSLRNRIELIKYSKDIDEPEFGFMAYQDINYHPLGKKLSGNLRFTMFKTVGFDTRIYAYENDVLYGFSIPAYQNEGIRFYLNARYNAKKGLDFWVKYALTAYQDKNQVGSGLELINGNKKSEIKLQARLAL